MRRPFCDFEGQIGYFPDLGFCWVILVKPRGEMVKGYCENVSILITNNSRP